MSSFGHAHHHPRSGIRALTTAIGAAMLGAVLIPSVASAAPSVLFVANINDCAIYGVGPSLATIKVTWKDSDGSLKHVQTVKSKANGSFQTTCDVDEQVERGDVFTARIGSRPARSFTVPGLGFHIDRVADTVTGKAPASTHLTIGFGGLSTKLDTTSDSGGTFSLDASSSVDIVGSGSVTVSLTAPSGDVVQRTLQAPFIAAYRGTSDIFVRGRPGSLVELQVFDGPTKLADVDCSVGPGGGCWLAITDDDGHPIRLQAGMRVVSTDIASDADFTIAPITVTGAPGTDVISGTCLAGQSGDWYISAWRPAGSGGVQRGGVTNALGRFSTDVTTKFDLRSGDKILEECGLATGDWIERRITVP